MVVVQPFAVAYYTDPDGNVEGAQRGETFTARDEKERDRLLKLGAARVADEPAPKVEPSTPVEPSRSGPTATTEAWREYADALGLTVPEGASRDAIVALVDDSRR